MDALNREIGRTAGEMAKIEALVQGVVSDHPDTMAALEAMGTELGGRIAAGTGHSVGWSAKKAHDALSAYLDVAHKAMNEALGLSDGYRG
jgi:hypothetical protein